MGPDMDPEYADVGGNRIAYRRVGHGPLIVLVHGAVCDGRVWSRQLLTLADLFTVVAWDAPGCGESSDPPESFRLPEYADALAGLIATLGGGEAHVVGHSFGGALALELARRHPDVVASMTLVGAYAGWAGSLTSDEVQRRLSFALDVADRLPGGFDPTSMPGLFTPAMDRAVADELAGIMSQIRPAATRAMAHALAEAVCAVRSSASTFQCCCCTATPTSDPRSTSRSICARTSRARDSSCCRGPGITSTSKIRLPSRRPCVSS